MAMQEAVPAPGLSAKAQPATGGAMKPKDEDAPAPSQEGDGGVWDSASLYEEILDEVEAFDYSSDGELDLAMRHPSQQLTVA
jgi:NAD-dependent histone deacetylase SIR2